MRITAALFILLFSLSSCFKEKALTAPTRSVTSATATVALVGPSYLPQIYYSLADSHIVSTNSRFAYDLAFDCDANKFNIWLNGAKLMQAAQLNNRTDLSQVQYADTLTTNWKLDIPSYNSDSNAIGYWGNFSSGAPTSYQKVYLLNLGLAQNNNQLGYRKMIVNDFSGSSYSITYANLDNSNQHTILIPKDQTRNYSYLSFLGDTLVNIEPDKTKWDILFTRYDYVFYSPFYLPYLVEGVLTNPYKVQAYKDSTVAYSSITRTSFDANRYSANRDVIGYDWKQYSLGTYTVKPYIMYFIKSQNRLYKLHFLSYYKGGLEGYPTFEYQEL